MASATGPQPVSTALPAGTWSVDPVHSSVEFQVRNMGIVWVRGVFTDFEGTVESTGEPRVVRASGTVEVASVDTRSEQRDQHLRGAEFFDVEISQITFESHEDRAKHRRAAGGRRPDHQGHHARGPTRRDGPGHR